MQIITTSIMDKRQIIEKIQDAYIPGACSIGEDASCEAVKQQFSKNTVALVIQELSRIIYNEIKDNGSFTFPGVGTLIIDGEFWFSFYHLLYDLENTLLYHIMQRLDCYFYGYDSTYKAL